MISVVQDDTSGDEHHQYKGYRGTSQNRNELELILGGKGKESKNSMPSAIFLRDRFLQEKRCVPMQSK